MTAIKSTIILASKSAFRCLLLCEQIWDILFIFPSKKIDTFNPKETIPVPLGQHKGGKQIIFLSWQVASGVNVFVLMQSLFLPLYQQYYENHIQSVFGIKME